MVINILIVYSPLTQNSMWQYLESHCNITQNVIAKKNQQMEKFHETYIITSSNVLLKPNFFK
jgi:hypothetical protein